MRGSIALVLSFLTCVAGVSTGWGQIYPPKPGVPLPTGYFERLESDHRAFQFRRAWKAETRRVQEARQALGVDALAAMDQAPAVTGTKRVPVLAARYSNTSSPPYGIADLQQALFDGPNPTGTVTEYYHEISRGRINLTGEVIGSGGSLFRLSRTDVYYEGTSGCNGLCGSANTGSFLKEILDGTDGAVDFSQYDNDGPDGVPNSGDDDGYVDFVAFVHPEFGGECGGDNIWSHRWVYDGWWGAPYETNDAAIGGGNIRVSDYTIQPLLSCNGFSRIEIGVYAHEFGHAFGLPDLYDTNSNDGFSEGIGVWGLMASGSWGGDSEHPDSPTHMSAWSKEQLGWVDPITLCSNGELDIPPVLDTGVVYRIYPHGLESPEYFLLEYRTPDGFDQYLPGDGLAIWHVDNENGGNGDENNKLVDLEEADGKFDLDAGLNRGDSGDVYPGSSANRTFDLTSYPDSKDNNRAPTGIALTSIDWGGSGITLSAELTECRLRVQGLGVDDSEWGDNGSNLSSSELVDLQVCVSNDFDVPRGETFVQVEVLSDKVTLLIDSAELGTVSKESPQCALFPLQASDAILDGEELEFRVTLTGSGGYETVHTTSLFAGEYVLVVEDNGPSAYSADYKNAILSAGYNPVVYDTRFLGQPSARTLEGALAVAWFTGHDSFTTLRRPEQLVLEAYLGNGGTLLLSGDDIGFDLVEDGSPRDKQFYETWLRAEYLEDISATNTLTGVSGDPLGDGLEFNLTPIKSKWPSVIQPANGSHAVLEYAPSTVGAVRYEGDYNLLYTAFNFEAGQPDQRNSLMTRFLERYIPADRTVPSLTVSASLDPSYDACDTVFLSWDAVDDTEITEVEVSLYQDGEFLRQVALFDYDPGALDWSPDAVGGNLALKVAVRDALQHQRVELSTSFEVTDSDLPHVRVLYPNGGENITPGEPVDILWEHSDCSGIAVAEVQVSYDGGETWEAVGETEGENLLNWTPPLESLSKVKIAVQVEDKAGKTGRDASDEPFYVGLKDIFADATRAVLLQNAPNPFSLETTAVFFLPEAAHVTFTVYDINGRFVREIDSGLREEGQDEITWDGLRENRSQAPSGIYFLVLESAIGNQVRKLVRQ